APCLLWSSEPSSKAETKESADSAKTDSANEGTSADQEVAADANSVRPFVYLDKAARDGRKPRNLAHKGLLHQELYRQAFLLAAREECGAVTRDARLKDPMPAEGDNLPFALASMNLPVSDEDPAPAVFKLEVRRGLPDKRKEKVVQFGLEKVPEREKLKASLIATEELSRGRFKEILEQEGFAAKDRPNSEHPVPEEVKTLLEDLVFTSQFAAIRQLHDLIRRQGESPFLLGALVRGYANLGILTELYWAPAHKVFKARALLYAQRMLTTGDDPCWARWHRAYAFALTGIPIWVVEDLEVGGQRRDQSQGKDSLDPPAWVGVIDAYGRQDVSGLKPDKFPERARSLAHLVRFQLFNQSRASRTVSSCMGPVAVRAFEALPRCYRLNQAISRCGGISSLHESTVRGTHMLGERVYVELLKMTGLPPAVKTICQSQGQQDSLLARLLGAPSSEPETEFSRRRRLARVLLSESPGHSDEHGQESDTKNKEATVRERTDRVPGDQGELSWANLGHLIREVSFLHVWQRARFLRYILGVPPEDWIERSEPLVADHPYRLILDAFAWDPREKSKAQQKASSQCNWDDMGMQAAKVLKVLWDREKRVGTPIVRQLVSHYDITMPDLRHCYRMPGLQKQSIPHLLKCLAIINPDSPLAVCIRLDNKWEDYPEQLARWAREYREFAIVQLLIGMHFIDEERYDEAVDCLKVAVEKAPAKSTYMVLAEAYYDQDREAKWLATLEEYLEQPSRSLGHTHVRALIAKRLRKKGQWKKALPYGEAAAQSYAAVGLRAAAYCHEGLGNWEEAKHYFKANADRYPRGGSVRWYMFCRRTGKGEVGAMRQRAKAYLDDPATRRDDKERPTDVAAFYLLEGDLEEALSLYEKRFDTDNSPYYGVHAALVADQLGQTERRDTLLEQVVKKGPEHTNDETDHPAWNDIKLAERFLDDLKQGGEAAFDIEAARKLHADDDRHVQPNVDYFLGKYLEQRGKEDQAIKCWRRCMASNVMRCANRTLGCWELIRRGHEPIPPARVTNTEEPKEEQAEKAGGVDTD
ncbi:MAG: tetratricopeptide repeat protein, partial [bacterium]